MSELIWFPTMKMSSSLACLLASRRCLTTRKAISYRFIFAYFRDYFINSLSSCVTIVRCERGSGQVHTGSLHSPHSGLHTSTSTTITPHIYHLNLNSISHA